jgi:hypothetical protein
MTVRTNPSWRICQSLLKRPLSGTSEASSGQYFLFINCLGLMTSVTIDGDEVPDTPDVPDVLVEKRQKRLVQLVIARQKAAEIKKRRSAPKKELKKLEDDIKERLYQEETERVKKLRDLHEKCCQGKVPGPTPAPAPAPTISSFEHRCSHLDDLVKELYLYS